MAENDNIQDAISIQRSLISLMDEKLNLQKEDAAISAALKSLHTSINKEIKKENAEKVKSNSLSEKIHTSQSKINKLAEAYKSLLPVAQEAARAKIAEHIRDIRRDTVKLAKEQIRLESMAYKQALLTQVLNKTGFEQVIKMSGELNEAFQKGGPWGVFTKAMLYALDIFFKIDEESARFRMTMGITREYMDTIQQDTRDIGFNLAHVGVTFDKVIDAGLALSKIMFSTMSATRAMVTDVALISAQLGVSAEASAEFMKNMGIVGRSTAAAKADLTFFTAKMTEAAGVPLKDIMEDVSNAAKSSYQFISRSSLALIKASVEAKRMGTNLADTVKSSSALLNFTQSVKDEMEASVLLGKGLNLQKARELAYNRDIKGLNNEILKLMKESNFEQLDPFQQDAVARALGKSAGELAQMAQAARERRDWETSTDPVVQRQLAAYNEMQGMTESIAKELGKSHREQLMIKQNQASITSITQSWNAILQRIGEGVLPLIEFLLRNIAIGIGYINKLMGDVNNWATSIGAGFGHFTKLAFGALIVIGLLVGSRYLGRLVGWAGGGVGRAVGNFFGGFARGVSKFGGANVLKGAAGLFVVAAALVPFAFAMKMMEGVSWKTVGIMAVGMLLLVGAVAALGAIMMSGVGTVAILAGAAALLILGVAMIPFAAAAWIASKALQNLANVPLFKIAAGLYALGLGAPLIVAGGLALGMASPGIVAFSFALRLLAGPAERVGKAMVDLGGGLKSTVEAMAMLQSLSFVGTIIQIKNLSAAVVELSKAINDMPDIKVEKLKTLMLPTQSAPGATTAGDTGGGILGEIRDGIIALRDDMKNGVLTANVYIDSQKLDSAMSRRLAYTGQLT